MGGGGGGEVFEDVGRLMHFQRQFIKSLYFYRVQLRTDTCLWSVPVNSSHHTTSSYLRKTTFGRDTDVFAVTKWNIGEKL